jgi:peroxiredoxin
MADSYENLPGGLPRPVDDGAAADLLGVTMPSVVLTATDGRSVDLGGLGPHTTILYVYPMTGRPGVDLPDGWDAIPGARGCTPEACAFRDHHSDLRAAGASTVYGLSSQDTDYQREAVERLHLPFSMLSDGDLVLSRMLGLPTFAVGQTTLYKRLTLVITDGRIEYVFSPVFPPDEHAAEVLAWLQDHPRSPRG